MLKIYECTPEPCKLCNTRNAIVYPLYEDDNKQFFYGVCKECRDKEPYKVIPIITRMDTGIFIVLISPADFKPLEIDPESFNPQQGIVTKYGKKLLREGAKHYKKVTISGNQNLTDGNVDGNQR